MSANTAVRVAVAGHGNDVINVHFGQADEFTIYDLSTGQASLIETRAVARYYQPGECEADKRQVIVRMLADCRALFAERVGDGPRRLLVQAGIEPVDRYARKPVEASLRAWLGGDPV